MNIKKNTKQNKQNPFFMNIYISLNIRCLIIYLMFKNSNEEHLNKNLINKTETQKKKLRVNK